MLRPGDGGDMGPPRLPEDLPRRTASRYSLPSRFVQPLSMTADEIAYFQNGESYGSCCGASRPEVCSPRAGAA